MKPSDEGRVDALIQLSSKNPHDRYLAAKALCKFGSPEDINKLMGARRFETDNITRHWLDEAIKECTDRVDPYATKVDQVELVIDSAMMESVRAQAVQTFSTILLHEIGSQIGLLSSVAQQEISGYDSSETAVHIRSLELIFDGVAQLRKAASPPNIAEFDIAGLIESIVYIEANSADVDVSLVGRKPLLIMSDVSLLRLALCNGIRNAIEAVRQIPGPLVHGIVINWGSTDSEFWVSVIDQGPGLVPGGDVAFDIGKTTKSGHSGFGLAIARQAMEKLNGTASLLRSPSGGATYEVRGKLV
jgi:signal transduction histidine kinase